MDGGGKLKIVQIADNRGFDGPWLMVVLATATTPEVNTAADTAVSSCSDPLIVTADDIQTVSESGGLAKLWAAEIQVVLEKP